MIIQNTSFLTPPSAQTHHVRTNTLGVEPRRSVDNNQGAPSNPPPAATPRALESQSNRVFASVPAASANEAFSASRDSGLPQNARAQDALNRYQQFENIDNEENVLQIRQLFGVDVFA